MELNKTEDNKCCFLHFGRGVQDPLSRDQGGGPWTPGPPPPLDPPQNLHSTYQASEFFTSHITPDPPPLGGPVYRVTIYLVAFLSGNQALLNIENNVQCFRFFKYDKDGSRLGNDDH